MSATAARPHSVFSAVREVSIPAAQAVYVAYDSQISAELRAGALLGPVIEDRAVSKISTAIIDIKPQLDFLHLGNFKLVIESERIILLILPIP